MGILFLYKPIGKTPLEIIQSVNDKKKSYAGRLDPMAHGYLLVLTNIDCLKQNTFHNTKKIYIFQLLFGIETDTLDILGFVKETNNLIIDNENIKKVIEKNVCSFDQEYPAYSSVRVNGKPLWYWAKNNMLDKINIPKKKVNVDSMEITNIKIINFRDLRLKILNNLKLLGDRKNQFRESDIRKQWEKFNYENEYKVITVKSLVSGGTYIRELCKKISKDLNTVGLALDIYRDKIIL